MKVWAVVFSNYLPIEVDSTWLTEQAAEVRAEELNKKWDWSPWDVQEWEVEE